MILESRLLLGGLTAGTLDKQSVNVALEVGVVLTMVNDERGGRLLEAALDARKFEIELFWKRALFFWGFIAIAFVSYAAALKESAMVAMVLSAFGVVCSCAWTLANRGSKYWHENWEQKVHREEMAVFGKPLFAPQELREDKGMWLSARRYSVTKLAIGLSDYVLFLWILLFARSAVAATCSDGALASMETIGGGVFAAFSVMYLGLLLWKGRSSMPAEDEPQSLQPKEHSDV